MEKIYSCILTIALICSLCSCGVQTTVTSPTNNQVARIDLNLTSTTIDRGEGTTLEATVSPSNATNYSITWDSSDYSVVSVEDNGYIVGVSTGTATITARADNGISATCYVTVEEPIEEISRDDVLSEEPDRLNFRMNSAGGIEFFWKHDYIGKKTINYITVTYSLYDAVGNLTPDDHKGLSTDTMRLIGPFEAGEAIDFNSDVFVYCDVCSKVSFDSLMFEYADGTFAKCHYGWYNQVN